MDMQKNEAIPAIGDHWSGQGGVYAGTVPARGGAAAYHLVIGNGQGRLTWGPYDEISSATDLEDGLANTQSLITQPDNHPAAQAAAAYVGDSHNDFYLPAVAELELIWNSLGSQDFGWVWSSSQHSAFSGYIFNFDDGTHSGYDKGLFLLVLPVRRVLWD
ncbi:DUF1566 domain-containing protein [Pseudomonas monteilii]|uniref:DUF1566 domain-containing protein n=1 Tax=Pseudomonas monteilii TaxID=76759 RepID=UPI001E352C21|nr:DUF1566 domain-containing protein [Pseudomonas monteilii]MCE0931625.1 DUF1566 domain-containing protein [Pseudomonas monteilii]MCE1009181.1 DUF1566 domain-containing protein [Pseudomonas monteilii]WJN90217.1 DUF1566 domain-containing protein [Pseudomonas monteilii]WJO34829.1 DUF1566 domain-containing protein [Pseudomonas monteilii]WJR41174.1 DUF1566 domain-containing protein [Pseudomonas monteilii]